MDFWNYGKMVKVKNTERLFIILFGSYLANFDLFAFFEEIRSV